SIAAWTGSVCEDSLSGSLLFAALRFMLMIIHGRGSHLQQQNAGGHQAGTVDIRWRIAIPS
ncbi:MAG TPA: hypothetical protein VMW24_14210, partial [Sedimentisphaerales bacterium]|nr:hypothetical protein [Sedimentisphaerales bacterium]